MKLAIKKATTDVSVYVFIQNSSLTTGAGLTGLVYNSASLVCYYVRPLAAAAALTLATQTVTGAHSDGGFVEVDATNMPGVYRLDLSDAVCATGVNSVVVMLKGATNMAPVLLEIQLVSYDPNDTVRLGLTALPNAAADAAGGLPISDAGGLDLDSIKSDTAAILVDTAEIGAAGAGLTNINLPDQTMNITGNLSGSVGSVTGAVGSVTGNVGGNVTGSVGSLATQAKADVNAEVDSAIADARLDELLAADSDIDGVAPPTVGSVFHELLTKTAGSFTYDQTTDSLEALRDRGDAAWITATGFSTLDAAGVRTAVGLASANLDTQLDALPTAAEIATAVGAPTAAAVADAVWDEDATAHQTQGSFGQAIGDPGVDTDTIYSLVTAIEVDTAEIGAAGAGLTNINLPNQTMDIVGNITGNLSGSVGSVSGAVGSVGTGGITAASFAAGAIDAAAIATNAIGSDELAASAITEIQSGLSTLDAAGVRTAVGLATANLDTQLADLPTATENADALLKRDMSAVTGESARSPLNSFRALRNKVTVLGTAVTVTKEDDLTTAWTAVVTTDASADPITAMDPA